MNLFFIAFALLIGSAVAGESPQLIPDSLTALGGNEPFWVSARSVTKNGKLDLSALPADARVVIESAGNPSQICPVIATSRHISEKGAGSWRALTENADAIYRATVVGRSAGFYHGVPSSLLILRIDRVLRPQPDYPGLGAIVYIDYPAADFTIDQTRYCSQSVRRDAFSPAVDDAVLLFACHPPTDTTHRYLPTSDEYVVFRRGHTLSLPQSLAGDAAIVRWASDRCW